MYEEVPSNKSLYLTLLAIHFKNASIIGKLLRAQQQLDRPAAWEPPLLGFPDRS
jgi:hypothetical protein